METAIKEVFKIVQAAKSADGRWFVIGRTYSAIHVGDTVSVIISESEQPHDFQVHALLMYERTVATLYPGDAAKVLLNGKDAEILQNAKVLFK